MDGFSGHNHRDILLADQHKMKFISPWGTLFAYQKLPFGLKKVGATFQRAMSYAFQDISHIVEPYLDDLLAHSQQWEDHPGHLRDILLRCLHYNIRLNPHKCVFCVDTGRLLGFVVSKDGIQIDPLKIASILALPTLTNIWLNQHKCVFCVETRSILGFVVSKYGIQIDPLKIAAIFSLPTPTNITELQSFQGKENFLRRFVCNFVEKMHGYMRLLKKDTPFF